MEWVQTVAAVAVVEGEEEEEGDDEANVAFENYYRT